MRGATKSRNWTRKAGDFYDRCLSVVSPSKAGRNQVLRNGLDEIRNYSSKHAGASRDRMKSNWIPGTDSADSALESDLPLLRERSRDLNRNNPIASGITNTIVSNEVGVGIRPQSSIDHETIGISPELAQALQRRMERGFGRWSRHADYEGRNDIADLESLIKRQILESGEALLVRHFKENKRRPYALCWQIIEPDRLSTPTDKANDPNISMGVEKDESGEPCAYYIAKEHPGNNKWYALSSVNDYVRVPAFDAEGRPNVLHVFKQERPDQSRGIPFFTPVIEQFEHLMGYQESEWVRARVTAAVALFIKAPDPMALANLNASGVQFNPSSQNQEFQQEVQPGMIGHLGPGEEPFTYNPQVPCSGYEQFVIKALQFIGAALGLPLELVLKDFSRTNYSSARAALLEARRIFKGNQEWLAKRFCQPTWELLIEEMMLRGELPEIRDWQTFRYEWTRATWIAPGWEWVDPLKEAQAAVLKIENRLGSKTEHFHSMGLDYEETMRKIQQEAAFEKEIGLAPIEDKSQKPGPKTNDSSGDQKEDEDA